jgi:hypothetical protein
MRGENTPSPDRRVALRGAGCAWRALLLRERLGRVPTVRWCGSRSSGRGPGEWGEFLAVPSLDVASMKRTS